MGPQQVLVRVEEDPEAAVASCHPEGKCWRLDPGSKVECLCHVRILFPDEKSNVSALLDAFAVVNLYINTINICKTEVSFKTNDVVKTVNIF